MKRVFWRALPSFAVLMLAALPALSEGPPASLSEYRARLERYQAAVERLGTKPSTASDLAREVPDTLDIATSQGTVEVQFGFLRDGLILFMKVGPNAKPAIVEGLSARLKALRSEADLYEQPGGADAAVRSRLDAILSAHEFRRVRGPNAWELLQQRIKAWIERQWLKLFPKVPDINNAGQIFVWVMIAIASSVFAVWLYRTSREQMQRPREILPFLPSARSWRAWLADARARAARGEWRDAIHLAFWAAVSHLEASGVWRPDKTRTPREYVSAIPDENPLQPTFATLAHKFEATWYGGRPASADDFDQFVAGLERLGCQG